jgi:hypothetical protein
MLNELTIPFMEYFIYTHRSALKKRNLYCVSLCGVNCETCGLSFANRNFPVPLVSNRNFADSNILPKTR